MTASSKLRPALVAVTIAAMLSAQPAPPQAAQGGPAIGGLNFDGASLTTVIDILCKNLKINYILDPKVSGKVTMNTYGEIKPVDVRQLLETILRINGAVI